MIDKTKTYWTGDSADDIADYLRAYTAEPSIDVKPVACRSCGSGVLEVKVDQDEGAVQVICPLCGAQKILLDCEEIWADARPKPVKCPICRDKRCNVQVGFLRRENGSAKWVYVGNRCVGCGTLGSYLDWKIDHEPTDEMEQNL